MAQGKCWRCGNIAEIPPRQAKCAPCIAAGKRITRNADPSVKEKEKARYQERKQDPAFVEKNRQRARDWNKKNRDKK